MLARTQRVTTRERGDIPGCHPAPRDQTLLEQLGLTPPSIAAQYSRAIRRYVSDQITWEEMNRLMSSKNVV